jgi:hypothetical protein
MTVKQRLLCECSLGSLHYELVESCKRQLKREGKTVKQAVAARKRYYERQYAAQR